MSYLLELQHVSKIYHEHTDHAVHALHDVSLQIRKGEFIAVIGQSGSGKTTLMNCLGCLDTPTYGQYLLEGENVACLHQRRLAQLRNRTIGFVFQGFNLLSELTALENVALPLRYRGVPRNVRLQIARAALEKVGLGHRTTHLPSQLSGGQQQRVAIARVLAADPPILLADEPTGNLDTASGAEVMQLLHNLHAAGRTVVLITHDPRIAENSSRILRMQNGRVIEDTVL